jgi:hypothetical protein
LLLAEGLGLGRHDAGIKPKKAGLAGGRGAQANRYQLLARALHQVINDGLIQNSPLSRSGIRRPPKCRSTEVVPMSVDDIERLAARRRTSVTG